MRIYDRSIELWNYGLLPEELTPADLLKKHSSYPRNHNIANVFYKAGFVGSWGRGYKKIAEEFDRAKMPLPIIEESYLSINLKVAEVSGLRSTKSDRNICLIEIITHICLHPCNTNIISRIKADRCRFSRRYLSAFIPATVSYLPAAIKFLLSLFFLFLSFFTFCSSDCLLHPYPYTCFS